MYIAPLHVVQSVLQEATKTSTWNHNKENDIHSWPIPMRHNSILILPNHFPKEPWLQSSSKVELKWGSLDIRGKALLQKGRESQYWLWLRNFQTKVTMADTEVLKTKMLIHWEPTFPHQFLPTTIGKLPFCGMGWCENQKWDPNVSQLWKCKNRSFLNSRLVYHLDINKVILIFELDENQHSLWSK